MPSVMALSHELSILPYARLLIYQAGYPCPWRQLHFGVLCEEQRCRWLTVVACFAA